MNKKKLYESIMKQVSREVKTVLENASFEDVEAHQEDMYALYETVARKLGMALRNENAPNPLTYAKATRYCKENRLDVIYYGRTQGTRGNDFSVFGNPEISELYPDQNEAQGVYVEYDDNTNNVIKIAVWY